MRARTALWVAAASLALAPAAPALAVLYARWPWAWLTLLAACVWALAAGLGTPRTAAAGQPLDAATADLTALQLADQALAPGGAR